MKNEETDLLARTKLFARRIIRLYTSLTKSDNVAQVLGKQVLRSGTSIGANDREANRGGPRRNSLPKWANV
jgi:four helix bundle protein